MFVRWDPVRSGPTRRPDPKSVWQEAHVLSKTARPRVRSAVLMASAVSFAR